MATPETPQPQPEHIAKKMEQPRATEEFPLYEAAVASEPEKIRAEGNAAWEIGANQLATAVTIARTSGLSVNFQPLG